MAQSEWPPGSRILEWPSSAYRFIIKQGIQTFGMGNKQSREPSKMSSYSQTLVGLSAIILSVCALGVSIYQAKIMRETQRATVWPFIEILPSNYGGETSLGVYNKGIGPAMIQTVYLTVDDKPFQNWRQLFDHYATDDKIPFTWSSISGRVLAPNDLIKAIQLESEDARAFQSVMGTMELNICYCSVYKECWNTNLKRETTETDSCPINLETGFTQ